MAKEKIFDKEPVIEKPLPEPKAIMLTCNHSIKYNDVKYLPGEVVSDVKDSDIKELLKYGKAI